GSMLDGAPFYDVYQCADGGYMSVGALEPKFYAELLQKLDLADDPEFKEQYDQSAWPACRARLKRIFAREPRAHWEGVFTNSDACVGPVLAPSEAAAHPHIAARSIYRQVDGVLHVAIAKRPEAQPKKIELE
ncbi:MAG: CoA transferase, partial [Planctomycetota bacterium]